MFIKTETNQYSAKEYYFPLIFSEKVYICLGGRQYSSDMYNNNTEKLGYNMYLGGQIMDRSLTNTGFSTLRHGSKSIIAIGV